MKRLTVLFCLIFVAFLTSCDKTNYQDGYQKGYADGYQNGQSAGDTEGFGRGQKAGYGQGYADGFAKSGKDLKVNDIVISNFTTDTLIAFGHVIAWLFLILNIVIITFCFMIDTNRALLLAKGITLAIAAGMAYASMLVIDLNTVLLFTINGLWGYLLNSGFFFFSVWFTSCMYNLSKEYVPFLIILILFLFTFDTCYFCLFLSDVNTYIIKNHFIIWTMFSVIMGSLVYVVYKLVDSQRPIAAS